MRPLRHAPPLLAAALHQARAGGVSGVRRFTAEGAEVAEGGEVKIVFL